jgi:hypothetical protein
MSPPTLDDAKALVRKLRHRDVPRLLAWIPATFDSFGAPRAPGYRKPDEKPPTKSSDS